MKYDYIIAGSGCAGLSLLYRILKNPILNSKTILVIDKEEKNTNNRTWCYWEKEDGLFESIVSHEWRTLIFSNSEFTKKFKLDDYTYKMIKGIDFYNLVLNFAKNFKNVDFVNERIDQILNEEDNAIVLTEHTKYSSSYVFNSTSIFYPEIKLENSLLQHFQGWVIKTKNDAFDKDVGTLMDFRINQQNGATFMYVLPTSSTEALIEYTLFSSALLPKEAYKIALENYINDYLNVDDYEITHDEFGIIPMSLADFSRKLEAGNKVVNIGTAGGYTKASSGYTFQFIQKNTDEIVKLLTKGQIPNPKKTLREKVYHWYDRTLLEVLISNKLEGKEIFSLMFKKIKPDTILAFLGNESSLLEDVTIMKSLPIKPFLIAGLKQLK